MFKLNVLCEVIVEYSIIGKIFLWICYLLYVILDKFFVCCEMGSDIEMIYLSMYKCMVVWDFIFISKCDNLSREEFKRFWIDYNFVEGIIKKIF